MHLITMHNSRKFYLNVIIISEVIYLLQHAGVSVKFLMIGETNSMVGYYLMAEGYSIQLGVWEAL